MWEVNGLFFIIIILEQAQLLHSLSLMQDCWQESELADSLKCQAVVGGLIENILKCFQK